ncbi:MAG: hypothetical protein ACHQPI_04185 [Thermoanaerobaculia bacterium]
MYVASAARVAGVLAAAAAAAADDVFLGAAVGAGADVEAVFVSFGSFAFGAFFARTVALSVVAGAGTVGAAVGGGSVGVTGNGGADVSGAGIAVAAGALSAPSAGVFELPFRSTTSPTMPARTTAPIAKRPTGAPDFFFGAPFCCAAAAWSAFAASSPIRRPEVIVRDSGSTDGVACVGVSEEAVASEAGGDQLAVSPVVRDIGVSPIACRRSAASSAAV